MSERWTLSDKALLEADRDRLREALALVNEAANTALAVKEGSVTGLLLTIEGISRSLSQPSDSPEREDWGEREGLLPDIEDSPEVCPTCGSDRSSWRHRTSFGGPRCDDPFHSPEGDK